MFHPHFGQAYHNGNGICKKFFVAVKFMICILMLGAILGLFGLYILDRDRFLKEKCRKMFKNIECFTHDVQKKINNHVK